MLSHDVTSVAGVEVCPGGSAELACTVTDISGFGATVWNGSNSVFDCVMGELILRHTIVMDTDNCGQLAIGRIVAADGNNFTSVLTVTAPDMSGSVLPVQCTFPQPIPDPPVVVMEYNVTVTGKCLTVAHACIQVHVFVSVL